MMTVQNVAVQFAKVVNDLGILLDSPLTMADHTQALSGSCIQLHQLRSIKQCLTLLGTKTLVHAFVSSHLDYSYSTFAGVSGQLLQTAIQNVIVHLATGARRHDHMTPVLCSLHWLLITYKTAVVMCTCLHDLAPAYLAAYCIPSSPDAGHCHLRSADITGQLVVPRTKTNYGDDRFSVHGPRVCGTVS